jgi:carboxyl-terminal processing protease
MTFRSWAGIATGAAGARSLLVLSVLGLHACGGGGGGGSSGSGNGSGSNSNAWMAGTFRPSSSFAARCAAPRSGIDSFSGKAFPDVQGATVDENNWLRSWTDELYLWYREVPDLNPALYATTANYFVLMKTAATTASGSPKDKFHFTLPTAQWEALSQSGKEVGYGAQWVIVSPTPPRQVTVAYLEPNSPATAPAVNLARGAQVLAVDGVDINVNTQAGADTLNAGLFPLNVNETHTFNILDLGASVSRNVTMQSVSITHMPVQNVATIATASGPVGYMLFNDHLATAEAALINAVDTLRAAHITDLVLDIRYNGGGYLDIASELAYMIAGSVPTAGQTFELTTFNDKYPSTDPVTGQPITPTPFHATTQGFSTTSGQALPTLDLPRVFVLTGGSTCSASESIVNGLRGIDVQVIQIGSTTCGKPYGFYPQDNCGTTYFSIELKGVNAKGFGDYTDGFSPSNTSGTLGVPLPGCSVADDFAHALGDAAESRLAAALNYRAGQNCPAATGLAPGERVKAQAARAPSGAIELTHESPWRENRILRPQ